MAPPLGQHSIIALDPGFRTGCKLVCLSHQGDLLHHDVIYPHMDGSGDGAKQSRATADKKMIELAKKYEVSAIAVGNGTAGRETEEFLHKIDWAGAGLAEPQVVMVNESGASIYSASDVAREEFPDQDLTVRGAVSIGRRLMDPLAELVKLDPKINRCRSVPARRGSIVPAKQPGRHGLELRQCSWCRAKHSKQAVAFICVGVGQTNCHQYRQAPPGKRPIQIAGRAKKGSPPGPEGF